MHFMKKLPKDAEASNILVGELNCLQNPISIFVRLNTALHLGDLTEVPVPTRFIFLLLGPTVRMNSSTNRIHGNHIFHKICGIHFSTNVMEFTFPQTLWNLFSKNSGIYFLQTLWNLVFYKRYGGIHFST